MNKILIISILTIIFVGTSPVSAWSPFEHSSKDWDWRDWTFLGVSIGVGLAAIAGSFYYAYRTYQNYLKNIYVHETAADRYVKRAQGWTVGEMDVNKFAGDVMFEPFNPDKTVKSIYGVHTIVFEDGSIASTFKNILPALKEIDLTLENIYKDGESWFRTCIVNADNPLFVITEHLDRYISDEFIPRTIQIESELHFHKPIIGFEGIAKETFTLGGIGELTHTDLFGKNLVAHMTDKSFYVHYTKYGPDDQYPMSNQNKPLKYMGERIV